MRGLVAADIADLVIRSRSVVASAKQCPYPGDAERALIASIEQLGAVIEVLASLLAEKSVRL